VPRHAGWDAHRQLGLGRSNAPAENDLWNDDRELRPRRISARWLGGRGQGSGARGAAGDDGDDGGEDGGSNGHGHEHGPVEVVGVAAGYDNSAAITGRGQLRTWGADMGLGNTASSSGAGELRYAAAAGAVLDSIVVAAPRLVRVLGGRRQPPPPQPGAGAGAPMGRGLCGGGGAVRVALVSVGSGHTACISAAGVLFTWGRGAKGRLGHGEGGGGGRAHNNQPTPRAVAFLAGQRLVGCDCGSAATAALTADGALYMCGELPTAGEFPPELGPPGPHAVRRAFPSWERVHFG
jgi:hypothetical protein